MNVLVYLVPLALALGGLGLAAFLWALRNGQFDDLDGAAWRAIADDDLPQDERKHGNVGARSPQGTKHRRAFEPARAQIVERLVGPVERIGRGRRSHLRLRRERQKLPAVGAGQVGDRGDAAFLP